jgi:predicted ATPase/DNA-binding winged helix-turn-helix (wHTH) protein
LTPAADAIVSFAAFRFDVRSGRLWRDADEVGLRPKTAAVLGCLIARPGDTVTKRELLEVVWPDGFVGDAALAVCINELRSVFGDDPRNPRFIVTAHRRGYRFIADVEMLSRSRRSNDLPLPLNALIGREDVVGKVVDLLRRRCRLVTLTGPGGTGKTRVALQAASDVADEFEHGVVFVNLAPIRDVDLVVPTVAMTLGVAEVTGTSITATLKERLQGQRLLLVLDNFEQVVGAAWQIADLASASPGIAVLTTSRVPMRVAGEREQPIPALDLPNQAHLPPVDELVHVDSVRLFAERASAIKPVFALTSDNAAAVAEICVRLDGLPLAIELAAARIRLLSPQAIASRLKNRLSLLTGGPSDADDRHRTLRGTIDWSYGLLDDAEQRLFRRLAVFSGGCTLPAIEAVCVEGLDVDVLNAIESLVQSNLLKDEDGPDGEPRLMTLETIHEFAREQLAASGELDLLRSRHARYFAELAESFDDQATLGLKAEATEFERLDAEHSNLLGAVEWTLAGVDEGEDERSELAARLVAALSRFWLDRGHWVEGARWAATVAANATTPNADLRARVLLGAGGLAVEHGDYESGRRFFEESVPLLRQAGEHERAAVALGRVGDCVYGVGDIQTARSLLRQSVEWLRALGAERNAGLMMTNLAEVSRAEGDYVEARHLQETALGILTSTGDDGSSWEAALRANLGNTLVRAGDLGAATAMLDCALTMSHRVGRTSGIAHSMIGISGVAGARHRPEHAARLFGAIDRILDDLGAQLWPADRLDYEHHVAVVRAQIDETTFRRAHREGWLLPFDEAVALARRVDG